MNEQTKAIDPVCLMLVDSGGIDIEYQGLRYSFCSKQCLERFETNPHLYIGHPTKPAPKQQGKSIIRKRLLKLDTAIPEAVSIQIKNHLAP